MVEKGEFPAFLSIAKESSTGMDTFPMCMYESVADSSRPGAYGG
jgi:hypothetical protein